MNHNVVLVTTVRLSVRGYAAPSAQEAARGVVAQIDLHNYLDRELRSAGLVDGIAWDEGPILSVLVEPAAAGAGDGAEGVMFDGDTLEPMVDLLSPLERKASAATLSRQFFEELMDSVETLGAIAEEHGIRTLADLMHLQAAILDGPGNFIDYYVDSSKAMEVVEALPSAETWKQYIKEAYLMGQMSDCTAVAG